MAHDTASRLAHVREMLATLRATDLEGNEVRLLGAITPREAECMMETIVERKLRRCVETGVAHGGSTQAICVALSQLDGEAERVNDFETVAF